MRTKNEVERPKLDWVEVESEDASWSRDLDMTTSYRAVDGDQYLLVGKNIFAGYYYEVQEKEKVVCSGRVASLRSAKGLAERMESKVRTRLKLEAEEWNAAGFVLATGGPDPDEIMIYAVNDSQWGFSLSESDGDQAWPGGFNCGHCEWEYLDDRDPRISQADHDENDDFIQEQRNR